MKWPVAFIKANGKEQGATDVRNKGDQGARIGRWRLGDLLMQPPGREASKAQAGVSAAPGEPGGGWGGGADGGSTLNTISACAT